MNEKPPQSSEKEQEFDFTKVLKVKFRGASADEIKKKQQLAYGVKNNFDIIVSPQGHGSIARDHAKDDFIGGGWIFTGDKKVTFFSGEFHEVPKKIQTAVRTVLQEALEWGYTKKDMEQEKKYLDEEILEKRDKKIKDKQKSRRKK